MTALSLYGSNVASTTLATACQLATASGGTETTVTTTGPASGNGYIEVLSQTGTISAASGTQPAASGKGWLLDSTLLEGQTIAAGNWAGSISLLDSAGTGPVTSFVLRASKRSSGGTYTTIATLILTSQTIHNTKTTYTFSATSASAISFAVGDRLYVDEFVQANGWGNDPIVNSVGNSASTGVVTDVEVDTPGYAPTITTSTRTITDTAALLVTKTRTVPTSAALLTTKSRTITDTAALLVTSKRTITDSAALLTTKTRTIPTSGALLTTRTRTIAAHAALLVTNKRTITNTAALVNARSVPTSAAITIVFNANTMLLVKSGEATLIVS